MASSFRKFIKGIRVVPESSSTSSESGDLEVDSGSGKLKYYNSTDATPNSAVVTEAHQATLTNKTLTSPVLNTPTADTITGISGGALTVQSSVDENLILQAQGTGNVNIQGIVVSNNTITGINSNPFIIQSDSGALSLQAPGGDVVQIETISVSGNTVIGGSGSPLTVQSASNENLILQAQGSGVVNITSKFAFSKSTPTNSSGALALPSTGYALVSSGINTIAAGSDGNVIILTNTSASAIPLANEYSALGDGIRTGSGGTIFLLPKASLILIYNATAPGYWYVVGGTGGSSTFNSVGSNAAVVAYNAVYLDSSSLAQKLDATTDSKVEFVGVSLDAGGGVVRVQVAGEVDIPAALIEGGSFIIGKPVYASVSNAGKYQSTLPSTAGNWIIPVGVATTATKMAINGAGSSTAVKLTSEADPYVYATVRSVSTTQSILSGDSIILATGGAGGITLTLPAPVSGKIFNIKKVDAGVGAITINTTSGTIDGAASKTIYYQYDSLTFVSDGTNYFLI